MKEIMIEIKGEPKFLGRDIIDGSTTILTSFEVEEDLDLVSNFNYKLKKEIEKVIVDHSDHDAINTNTYLISEFVNEKFKRYLKSLKILSINEDDFGMKNKYFFNQEDEDMLKVVHRPTNSAEKIDRIRRYLYWNDKEIDATTEFLHKRYLTKVRRI